MKRYGRAAGVLAGGHTIMDEGIKYGLSVCGRVHPDRILTNHDCEAGDTPLLTKLSGRRPHLHGGPMETVSGPDLELALESMRTLNRSFRDHPEIPYPCLHRCDRLWIPGASL